MLRKSINIYILILLQGVAGGLLWQAFTLTPAGHRFVKFMDILISPKVKLGRDKKWNCLVYLY